MKAEILILSLVMLLGCFFGISEGFSVSRSLVMRSAPLSPPRKSSSRSARIEAGTTKRMKQMKKKSYDIPGYIRGDIVLLQSVFEAHSLREKLSFESFVKSRYLRFWPGRKAEAETIWMEITKSSSTIHSPNSNNNEEMTEMATSSIHMDQLPELLKRLDEISYQMEKEMEDERVEWEVIIDQLSCVVTISSDPILILPFSLPIFLSHSYSPSSFTSSPFVFPFLGTNIDLGYA